ncbi:asparaginyl-tRNA synthetase, partial [Elasticomyces elasticus]
MTWRCARSSCLSLLLRGLSSQSRHNLRVVPVPLPRHFNTTRLLRSSDSTAEDTPELASSSAAAPKRRADYTALELEQLRNQGRRWLSIKHIDLVRDGSPECQPIKVTGLVRTIRKQKRVAFAHIDDGTTFAPLQAILTPEQAEQITNGSYVELVGNWQKSQGKGQSYELEVLGVTSVGECDADVYPLQKKSMGVEHLRNYPHLRMRLPQYSLLQRVRAQMIASVHEFYASTGDP